MRESAIHTSTAIHMHNGAAIIQATRLPTCLTTSGNTNATSAANINHRAMTDQAEESPSNPSSALDVE